MQVTIVEKPEMKAAVLRSVRNGRSVREAWKQLIGKIGDHPARKEHAIGIVFIPEWQWQWTNGVEELWVGVEVTEFEHLPEGLETIVIPARKFATITVKGDRTHMNEVYRYLWDWFSKEGYERDVTEGSYGYEANRLQPIDPFSIPADVIDYFDFDIYAPIKER